MIQNYTNLKLQVDKTKDLLGKSGQIQKIFSTVNFICLSLRVPGKSFVIYIGRGKSTQGIWEGEKGPPSELRLRDQFLEYLRKHLRSRTLINLSVDDKDRILCLEYVNSGKLSRFFIFYNGSKTYWVNCAYDELLLKYMIYGSYGKFEVDSLITFSFFDNHGRREVVNNKSKKILPLSDLLSKEKASLVKFSSKKEKFLKRKIANISLDLQRIDHAKKLFDELKRDQVPLERLPSKTQIEGIRFNFKQRGHYQRASEAFNRLKGFLASEKLLTKRLIKTQKELKELNPVNFKQLLQATPVIWPKSMEKKKITERAPTQYRVFDFDDFQLGIGLSSQGNDELRTRWAKRDDLWFHLDKDSSPHVIAKTNMNINEILEEVLLRVAILIREYAKLNTHEIDLVYAQVKNVRGVKGQKGSVLFKKEKRRRVFCD